VTPLNVAGIEAKAPSGRDFGSKSPAVIALRGPSPP